MNKPLSDCGHGHVIPAPFKARCGGPALCSACAADLKYLREHAASFDRTQAFKNTIHRILGEYSAWIAMPDHEVAEKVATAAIFAASAAIVRADDEEAARLESENAELRAENERLNRALVARQSSEDSLHKSVRIIAEQRSQWMQAAYAELPDEHGFPGVLWQALAETLKAENAEMRTALEAVHKNRNYMTPAGYENCRFCDTIMDGQTAHEPDCEILKVRAALKRGEP